MFGSISNWITTTSSNITSNIPLVTLPNIPVIFPKNSPKSEQDILNPEKVNDEHKSLTKENSADKIDPSNPLTILNDEEKTNKQEIENKYNLENTDLVKDAEEKIGVMSQLDIDAQKAYGQAKEIGSNIGSKIARFIIYFIFYGLKCLAQIFFFDNYLVVNVNQAIQKTSIQARFLILGIRFKRV